MVAATMVVSTRRLRPDRNHNLIDVAGHAVLDAKYHYNCWRPITAIRNGDIDGNPATDREATWQPIATTPMHPEYPVAHFRSSPGSGHPQRRLSAWRDRARGCCR